MMMIELLLATALSCSEAKELIDKVSVSQGVDRDAIIEVIKTNTKEGCYEGSESNS